MSNVKHVLLETISLSRSHVVDNAEAIQLIQSMTNEHCDALNGIEGYGGMRWGELRKWEDSPINLIKMQASLFTVLRQKDLLLVPTSKTMLDLQEYINYNDKHPDDRTHFLKRFPPGTYEYTLVPTIYSGPIFARTTDGDIVEYAAPYFDKLVFRSDTHPWFVAAFARWHFYESRRGFSYRFEAQFPVGDFELAATAPQPLNFYRQPYLGWTPRSMPYHIEEQIGFKSNASAPSLMSSSSSSSFEFDRPRKRTKHEHLSSSNIETRQKQRISTWRYRVVSIDDASIASDEVLRAYAMEEVRLVQDVIGRDPIYQKLMTVSKIATNPSSSLRRKRACPNVH